MIHMIEDMQRAPALAQRGITKPYVVVIVQSFADSRGRHCPR